MGGGGARAPPVPPGMPPGLSGGMGMVGGIIQNTMMGMPAEMFPGVPQPQNQSGGNTIETCKPGVLGRMGGRARGHCLQ